MAEISDAVTSLLVTLSTITLVSFLFAFTLWKLALLWAPKAYHRMVANNHVSVDEFVQQPKGPTSSVSCLKCLIWNFFNVGNRTPGADGLTLRAEDSDKVPGLKVTYRKEDGVGESIQQTNGTKPSPIVVGTIRMGFGHHRIAYATCSWGLDNTTHPKYANDRDVYFHDFLNIDSEEANLIRDIDKLYSKGSRLATELGGYVERFWGFLTKSGDEDSLRVTYQSAEHLRPLTLGLDKDSPIIASHSLVAAAAVAAGFTNVINLVIDNHAQWFIVVPGCLNLVQGPSNYHSLLKMGVPQDRIALAGHWIPRDLVVGIPDTCQWRIRRAKHRVEGGVGGPSLRIVVPVGGAGAQKTYVTNMIRALTPLVQANSVHLFLNAGDHSHMKDAFVEVLDEMKLAYEHVPDMNGVKEFQNKLQGGGEPTKAVTLFAFEEYFTAVATTDILCNVSDVLACKPSELAFYPIPKLMIRRVGDHEAYSAYRASEIGDGTLEAREVEDALKYVQLFLDTDLLVQMNEAIVRNGRDGVYDGCKNAVRIALERAAAAYAAKND